MKISIIAAHDKNRAIGKDNRLIWHLPADMHWFKTKTMNKVVVMGRNTYESIGKALPGRVNIVLSRKLYCAEDAIVAHSIEQATNIAKSIYDLSADWVDDEPELMVMGGEQVYRAFMPYAHRLYVTRVDTEVYDADAWFPEYYSELGPWSRMGWQIKHPADNTNAFAMTMEGYERKSLEEYGAGLMAEQIRQQVDDDILSKVKNESIR